MAEADPGEKKEREPRNCCRIPPLSAYVCAYIRAGWLRESMMTPDHSVPFRAVGRGGWYSRYWISKLSLAVRIWLTTATWLFSGSEHLARDSRILLNWRLVFIRNLPLYFPTFNSVVRRCFDIFAWESDWSNERASLCKCLSWTL